MNKATMDLEMKKNNENMNSLASLDTIEWNVYKNEEEETNNKRNKRKKDQSNTVLLSTVELNCTRNDCVRKIQMRSIQLWIFLFLLFFSLNAPVDLVDCQTLEINRVLQ